MSPIAYDPRRPAAPLRFDAGESAIVLPHAQADPRLLGALERRVQGPFPPAHVVYHVPVFRYAPLWILMLASLACRSSRLPDEDPPKAKRTNPDESRSRIGRDTGSSERDVDLVTECPVVSSGEIQGIVVAPEINEASGMVRSRTQELLWVHNDSGDRARFFAIGFDGARLGTVELVGAGAIDWEGLALGPGPEPGDYLYAGDIGDNDAVRRGITIYRLLEPADFTQDAIDPVLLGDWDAIELSYPDRPHNAETLLVDPWSGDLFIVTKDVETLLFRRPAPISSGTLEQMPNPRYPGMTATAGDVSPLGDWVMIRGYTEAFAWWRMPGETLGEAMLSEPCAMPLAVELQGETLSIDADGLGYFTLSEKTRQPLWYFPLTG